MANEQNLIPQAHVLSVEEQSKGGNASAESRRQKKNLRLALEMLLEKDFKDKEGKTITGAEAITAKLFQQAMNGNVKAFETLRDTVGQKPVERIVVAEVEQSVIDEVEAAILDDTE
jgi:hypothetical protein